LPQFNPQQLDRFTLIGLPLPLPGGDPVPQLRKVVVIKHFPTFLFSLAPITRTQPYSRDPGLAAGCVRYAAREVPGFSGEVVIEPRRTHRRALEYAAIEREINRGTFREFGALPPDFQQRFLDAIEQNRLLNRTEKEVWRDLVS
jgi:hypothetical protein